jgi:hypothetical protein
VKLVLKDFMGTQLMVENVKNVVVTIKVTIVIKKMENAIVLQKG